MQKTIFNILDFGAVGDGKTDDTHALQAALDAATACRGKVTVPPGIYRTGRLKMGAGTILEGDAAWSFRNYGASVLELADENTECLLDITNAFGCAVRGLSLNGRGLGKTVHGILLQRDEYNGGGQEDTPTFDNCRIGHFSGDGIRLEKIWCFSVRHSMLCFNGGAGLFIDGWDGFILDNWFSANADGGIRGGKVCASLTVTGNRVEWNRRYGFYFPEGDSYNITGNFFDRSFGPGLLLGTAESSVETVTVTGNIFRRSGAEDVFADNDFSSHIFLKNCTNCIVTGNALWAGENDGGGGRYSPDYGIVTGCLTDCIVRDNVMHNGFVKEGLHIAGNE